MLIDERSLEALDFARVRERVAGQTHTAAAAALAVALEPSDDAPTVRRLLAETSEMRALRREGLVALTRVDDVREAAGSAERGSALPGESVRAIGDALAAAAAVVRAIREAAVDAPFLRARCAAVRPLPALARRILDALDERGVVLDRASPALARLRRAIARAQDEARERTSALARSSRYARALQDAIVTVRDGRYVVPIKAEFAGEFPGIVHDTSASGQTLFVEPLETLETNNRVRALRSQEQHEVERILAELSAAIGAEASAVRVAVECYVDLDLTAARASVADRMGAVEPELIDAAAIDVREGRHPLLDERAIPQSVRLDDEIRAIVISGPNMGGKTVALKLVGLFVVMAACGLHVPAEAATIGRFTRVFTDIGDEQSIVQNTSTFSAHLGRLAEIVATADDRSLILIDEIGAGTEPNAGAALAIAVLERFLAVGAHCVVTTHATELKLFAADQAHVRNASVRFDPHDYTPTYQLDVGAPGRSLAFPLARTMHVDPAVVARAEALLSAQERDYERALAELAEERERASSERRQLDRERGQLRALEDGLRGRQEALERERRELAARAETQLGAALRRFGEELERRAAARGETLRSPRVSRGQAELLARTLDELRTDLGLQQRRADRTAGEGRPVAVGERVRVLPLDGEGVVLEDQGDQLIVQLGALRTSVARADVRPLGAARPPRAQAVTGATRLAVASAARTELDVRGKRYVEAEPLVERWIDDALLAGASPLRLIHGKGTGLLGRGLQQYLREHPHVRGVRYGGPEEGGSGVTVFELGP